MVNGRTIRTIDNDKMLFMEAPRAYVCGHNFRQRGSHSALRCSGKTEVAVLICPRATVASNYRRSVKHHRPMHFIVLATDYDGTLAHDGVVDDKTIAAVERLRNSGRRIVLVTGRHRPDLCKIFPRLELFDRVIVENGGVLYRPETHEEKPLCPPPNERFINLLRERNIPFSVGRTIVATWEPHD